jgi:antitoxin component of RelBE/YafQ-DinJ toxin-antitoxin module
VSDYNYDIHIRLDSVQKKQWRMLAAKYNMTLSDVAAMLLLEHFHANKNDTELLKHLEYNHKI